jgi:hypothetical protein
LELSTREQFNGAHRSIQRPPICASAVFRSVPQSRMVRKPNPFDQMPKLDPICDNN